MIDSFSGRPAPLFPSDHPDWAPALKLGHNKIYVSAQSVPRHERAQERRAKKRRLEVAESLLQLCSQTPPETCALRTVDIIDSGITCQTDLTAIDMMEMEANIKALEEDNMRLREEVHKFKDKCLHSTLSQPELEHNNEKVNFYTGLANFSLLMSVFRHVIAQVPTSSKNVLDSFSEFLMTIIRLRLNVPLRDLAYRFNTSESTASRIFEKWIEILDVRLRHIVRWPNREDLRKTMPLTFQEAFGNKVAVIIDCFEVFVERPSSLAARAMTWSNYKHHNTVKFLVGIAPQGVITFVSDAWGGRSSDKHITENCSILKNILPGDVVLADRGFTIEDSVSLYCAELNIPAFTKGKTQLSPSEVRNSRKIAAVRIHVERVIGLVRRKYQVLQGTLPIHLLKTKDGQGSPTIDKIARVCCALTNISNSVVPFD
ncbi:uncharacterized protein LOC144003248 isoform X2 [Festucalex cinctus]